MGRIMKSSHGHEHRVLILDDHPIVSSGIKDLINQQEDLQVCCELSKSDRMLAAIEKSKPDLVIIDLSLKGANGIDVMKRILPRHPQLPFLFLSMHDESLWAERALRAGAIGYIMKEEATGNLLKAIRQVLSGDFYLSDKMRTKILRRFVNGKSEISFPIDRLSDRELEVLQLIGQGYGTSEIAKRLFLSVKTIETYRSHLKEKLSLHDANELVRFAIHWARDVAVA